MRSQKLSESRCFNFVPLLNWKKIESHFETWSSDAQRINLTFVTYSFVANFVRYISSKYYLNWFSFHTVIMKVLGVNFFWNTVYIVHLHAPTTAIYYYSARKLIVILPSYTAYKTELSYLVCYILRWFTCTQMVTHPDTIWVWRTATTLIEANALPLNDTDNHVLIYINIKLQIVIHAIGLAISQH